MSSIDETCELLVDYFKKISAFVSKKDQMEKKLNVFNKEDLDQANLDLEKSIREKKDLLYRIHTIDSEISDFTNIIPELTSSIEAKLRSLTSVKYQIK